VPTIASGPCGADRQISAYRCIRVEDALAHLARALGLFVLPHTGTPSVPAGAGPKQASGAPQVAEVDADELLDLVDAQHGVGPASGFSKCKGWMKITTRSAKVR
jgi:hypothetical protein